AGGDAGDGAGGGRDRRRARPWKAPGAGGSVFAVAVACRRTGGRTGSRTGAAARAGAWVGRHLAPAKRRDAGTRTAGRVRRRGPAASAEMGRRGEREAGGGAAG